MSRSVTIALLVLAVAAAVLLFVFEPRLTSTREKEATRDFVLNFDPSSIQGIRVASGNDGYEIELRESGWWIGPKPKDAASPQKVAELLKAAAEMRVFDVIRPADRGGKDLGDFGLEKPKSRIDLRGDGKGTVLFGKEAAADDRVYVRNEDSEDIYVVSDDLQRLAFRSTQEFRDKRLSNIASNRIDGITIKRSAGEISLQRGGRGWEIARPFRARADDAAVEKLLRELTGLQIVEFVADDTNDLSAYGLGGPRAEIILTFDGIVRPLALRIGPDAAGNTVIAQFTARDSVYRLPARALELLQVAPDQLRDRRVADLNLDTVDAIRFEAGDSKELVERSGDGWKAAGKEMSDEEVTRQVRMLTDAKVIEYLPLTDENIRKAGLDKPSGRIGFDAWLSENTPETTAGRRAVLTLTIGRQDAGRAYLRVNDDPEICVVPSVQTDIFR
jgi:Domain of unknown function (DUF4340)